MYANYPNFSASQHVERAVTAASAGDFALAERALISAKAQRSWSCPYGMDSEVQFAGEFASWREQIEKARAVWEEEAPIRAAAQEVAELKAEIAKIEKGEADRLARLAREAAREVQMAILEEEAADLREKLDSMKPSEPVSEEGASGEAFPEEAASEYVEEAYLDTETQPVEPTGPPPHQEEASKISKSEEMLHLLIGVGVYMAFGAWLWSTLSDRANQLF